MKREKRTTKRERQAAAPPRPPQQPSTRSAAAGNSERHIHCVACGRHLDPVHFESPATATVIQCQHKSQFAACVGCVPKATALLAEHDRSGQPVKVASAWH